MSFEQVYLHFIYMLFIELAILTFVTILLFIALIVAMNKLNDKKNTSLSDH